MAISNFDKGYVFSANPREDGAIWEVGMIDFTPIFKDLNYIKRTVDELISLPRHTPRQREVLERVYQILAHIKIEPVEKGVSLATTGDINLQLYERLSSYVKVQKVAELTRLGGEDKFPVLDSEDIKEVNKSTFKLILEERISHAYDSIEDMRQKTEILRMNQIPKNEREFHEMGIRVSERSINEIVMDFPYHAVKLYYKDDVVIDELSKGYKDGSLHTLKKSDCVARIVADKQRKLGIKRFIDQIDSSQK